MELNLEIGQRIKKIRGSISQAAFSKKLNVTQSTIGRYEKGGRSPDAEFILLVKEHYGINPNWLISGIEPKYMQNGLSTSIYNDTISEATEQTPVNYDDESQVDQGNQGDQVDQPTITRLITKTIEILESKTIYSTALSANIQAFHKAATLEQQFHELQVSTQAGMNKMESRITTQGAEINKLQEQIKNMPPGDCKMVANEA